MRRSLQPAAYAVVLALSSIACSSPPADTEPARQPASERSPRFPPLAAPRDLTIRYWVAGCSVAEDFWRFRTESKTVTCDPRGRTLETASGALVWPDYIAAEEIDVLAVEGEALEDLGFALWWSAGDEFTPERSIAALEDDADGDRVRFELASHPEWQGRIRRFRLTWTGTPPAASRVTAAWAEKRAALPESGATR